MRIHLGAVGQLKDGAERQLFDRYVERFANQGRQIHIGPLSVNEVPESRARSAVQRRREEAEALLKKAPADAMLIALDEKDKGLTSCAFATMLATYRDEGSPCLAFVIGGADGHGDDLLRAANHKLSLGPMTLPHRLARIVLAEQLYRAMTILTGHPYHRE